MNTKKHFRRLVDIAKEDGILSALEYGLLVARNESKVINFLYPSLGTSANYCEVTSKYYTAVFNPDGLLVGLDLK